MSWHGYIGIEIVTMTAANKQTLVGALKRIGRQSGPHPNKIMHWRIRPDGDAAIFEAEFQDDEVTAQSIANRLAALYNIPVANVSTTVSQTAYGPLAIFKTGATTRLRLLVFGGLGASWETSRAAAAQYIKDNQAAWEQEVA